ncbi:hypothetical protein AKJ47_01595 [candidate division MSBL1 archaeon SCGC-AAA261G05]|uniref:Probable dihydroorotate dehydrogenase B (NAD(+)), electron transfer subunit n=2 Tax=candidate division MSBL1 TaxID=215777 RepID=A0A133VBJ1_9EURY|nr:hypothetical protein AKJ47_01595 [candidate division MSBL1 archaeon SCGC-AAA261G05]KXB04420.1 hypothetical protein AKJ48_02650 [candidate division MSBL1 archaeon SCGC-AAA261O19]
MEGSSLEKHRTQVQQLVRVKRETPTIKSFYVDCPSIASSSSPGQFVMVWVIGVDEIPMSVSSAKGGVLGFTVEEVGEATSKLYELREGDLVGVRGPYGNKFDLSEENLLMIGGGSGVAPLAFAAEKAVSEGKKVTAVIGASTGNELLFVSRLRELEVETIVTTEDGTAGVKGLATGVLEDLLVERKFDHLFACGPEPMLKIIFDLAEKYEIPLQVSLERMMKCSVGLCGSCCIGPYRVCSDGPVFTKSELRRVKDEFGIFKRDASGRKVGF